MFAHGSGCRVDFAPSFKGGARASRVWPIKWNDGGDGRGHPKDLPTTPLDGLRDPHGPHLRIRWTVQKVSPNFLPTHITFYDDDAFTQPVTLTNIWERKTERKWEILDDGSCFENNGAFKHTKVEPGFIKF